MPRLVVVHHSPPGSMTTMLDAVLRGANNPLVDNVDVTVRSALAATDADILDCDGLILGTPANLGYMSGALKHFFDTAYPGALSRTRGLPFGVFLHGESDTDGARDAIAKIATGLQWRLAQPVLSSIGPVSEQTVSDCEELGAAMAALTTT